MNIADCLDALEPFIEPPFSRAQLETSVAAHPQTSATLFELLPRLEGLSLREALIEESLAYGRLQGGEEHIAWLASRKAEAVLPAGDLRLSREDSLLEITLNRPDAHNAIDRSMRDALREAFTISALDPEVEHVRLRANGKAFCIGGDLAEFGTTRDPATAHAIRLETLPAFAIVDCADKMEVHVQGPCIGAGLEMAAFAKRMSATHDAWFQLPELSMGLIPGAGGCVSVPRRIGWQRTALMILSGRRVPTRTALDWGLIDEISP